MIGKTGMVDSSTFRSVRASSGRKELFFLMKLELSETLNCLPFLSYQSCHCLINRPIVLLRSGLETGHPDQGPALFMHFAMLKIVKLAHLLSTSPEFSCRMFLQKSFSSRLTVLGFFDWPMAVCVCFFFFFSKESCATGG